MMDRYRTWLYIHAEPILAAILIVVVLLGFLLILNT